MLQVLVLERLPSKNPCIERQKSDSGHKSSKEHLTVKNCRDTSGNHILKLVIGKFGR